MSVVGKPPRFRSVPAWLPMLTLVFTVGVDFGTLNTAIAVARNRGVDVVRLPVPPPFPLPFGPVPC